MDINIRDNRLSTPLHWACYSRSEVSLNYLLAMSPDLEAQDQKGFTPLHLAVKSVEVLKSTRPVRALLLKGANRLAKDNEGRTAADHVPQNLPETVRNDLIFMLVIIFPHIYYSLEKTKLLGMFNDQDTLSTTEAQS